MPRADRGHTVTGRRRTRATGTTAATLGANGFDDAFHQLIVDNLADGVYYVDRERRITYWNHGAETLTGYPAENVVGVHCYDDLLSHVDASGRGLCRDGCPLAATIADGARRECEVWLRHSDGSRRPVRVRTAPIRRDGTIVGAVEIFDDATTLVSAREAAQRAEHDALTDAVTGLANRRLFDAVLAARVEDAARYGTAVGLLILDLDRFKVVNDTFGHAVGDEVLRVVASTLRGAIRAADTVARWGGEEFAVVAGRVDERGLAETAERLRVLVAASKVRTAAGTAVAPKVSIGGAITCPGDTPESLLQRADRALYEAKATGRNRVVLARPGA
jgi:diguanylate cyclase (GGDEF)-like protein/PAS domain S-box-containing protein